MWVLVTLAGFALAWYLLKHVPIARDTLRDKGFDAHCDEALSLLDDDRRDPVRPPLHLVDGEQS